MAELVDALAGEADVLLTSARNHPSWEVNQETGIAGSSPASDTKKPLRLKAVLISNFKMLQLRRLEHNKNTKII